MLALWLFFFLNSAWCPAAGASHTCFTLSWRHPSFLLNLFQSEIPKATLFYKEFHNNPIWEQEIGISKYQISYIYLLQCDMACQARFSKAKPLITSQKVLNCILLFLVPCYLHWTTYSKTPPASTYISLFKEKEQKVLVDHLQSCNMPWPHCMNP